MGIAVPMLSHPVPDFTVVVCPSGKRVICPVIPRFYSRHADFRHGGPMSASERPARLDVIGFGNAIVDVIGSADERLLERLELAKGTMTLPLADT